MTISMFWAALSYRKQEQQSELWVGAVFSRHWPTVEWFAVGIWFPLFVSLAQGYADHVERGDRQKLIYCSATFLMMVLAKDLAMQMFTEWRAAASPAVLARAFSMWGQVFVAACLQVVHNVYAWCKDKNHMTASRDIHWLILIRLVRTWFCDFRSLRRSQAFTNVLIAYMYSSLQKILAIWGIQPLDGCISFCFAMGLLSKVRGNVHPELPN